MKSWFLFTTPEERGLPLLEICLTIFAIVVTAGASVMVVADMAAALKAALKSSSSTSLIIIVLYSFILFFLVYGSLVYLLARVGSLVRRWHFFRKSDSETCLPEEDAPLLTVLIPSYKEELSVVTRTVLSAALQTYPNKRVVVLVDDPPHSNCAEDNAALENMRKLPERISSQLAVPLGLIQASHRDYRETLHLSSSECPQERITEERTRIRSVIEGVIFWFDQIMTCVEDDHHEKVFFKQHFLGSYQARLQKALQEIDQIEQLHEFNLMYRSLLGIFNAEVTCFERKQFENLSHEPNKAMNLNSYISLIGKNWEIVTHSNIEGKKVKHLRTTTRQSEATVAVPYSPFLLTLDADSILLPDYADRLVTELEREENSNLAVIQTPYSAFPNPANLLERYAGATTDIQYLIHQGFTSAGATFWVGANALLRTEAIYDIVETFTERGFEMNRYIQDRTVIEDTESSIDLVHQGWQLANYPARLSYSATPPDFGSLLIQRRRWANGGLIILPKLLAYIAENLASPRTWSEAFMRIHYLSSIAVVNFGMLFVFLVPLPEAASSWWIPLTALPYFALYTRDLCRFGYRPRDVLGVYILNLLLIPVNIGGVCKSIEQMITRKQIPFGRTPKVEGRTASSPLYILAIFILLGLWGTSVVYDISEGRYAHGLFAFANVSLLFYGTVILIGLSECVEDLKPLVKTTQVALAPRLQVGRLFKRRT
jgi:cellulose synthase (UDP-forming)